MLQKVEMYTVICDNCKKDIGSEQDYSCWHDKNYAETNASDSDWCKEEGKHYCPDCFSYDNEDKFIISKDRKDKYKIY